VTTHSRQLLASNVLNVNSSVAPFTDPLTFNMNRKSGQTLSVIAFSIHLTGIWCKAFSSGCFVCGLFTCCCIHSVVSSSGRRPSTTEKSTSFHFSGCVLDRRFCSIQPLATRFELGLTGRWKAGRWATVPVLSRAFLVALLLVAVDLLLSSLELLTLLIFLDLLLESILAASLNSRATFSRSDEDFTPTLISGLSVPLPFLLRSATC